MDKSLIYLIVGLAGLIFSAIPFGVFMGIASQFNITDPNSSYLLIMLYAITIALAYGVSFGSFALIQNHSCGKVKNIKQIAGNSGSSTMIIVLMLTLVVFIPGLRSIVEELFPPSIDTNVKAALAYGYFLFWGALYGFSTGGFLAANCGT
jgi:uncharacterized BrkB/YihY/UPF0761 family membrane protein